MLDFVRRLVLKREHIIIFSILQGCW